MYMITKTDVGFFSIRRDLFIIRGDFTDIRHFFNTLFYDYCLFGGHEIFHSGDNKIIVFQFIIPYATPAILHEVFRNRCRIAVWKCFRLSTNPIRKNKYPKTYIIFLFHHRQIHRNTYLCYLISIQSIKEFNLWQKRFLTK